MSDYDSYINGLAKKKKKELDKRDNNYQLNITYIDSVATELKSMYSKPKSSSKKRFSFGSFSKESLLLKRRLSKTNKNLIEQTKEYISQEFKDMYTQSLNENATIQTIKKRELEKSVNSTVDYIQRNSNSTKEANTLINQLETQAETPPPLPVHPMIHLKGQIGGPLDIPQKEWDERRGKTTAKAKSPPKTVSTNLNTLSTSIATTGSTSGTLGKFKGKKPLRTAGPPPSKKDKQPPSNKDKPPLPPRPIVSSNATSSITSITTSNLKPKKRPLRTAPPPPKRTLKTTAYTSKVSKRLSDYFVFPDKCSTYERKLINLPNELHNFFEGFKQLDSGGAGDCGYNSLSEAFNSMELCGKDTWNYKTLRHILADYYKSVGNSQIEINKILGKEWLNTDTIRDLVSLTLLKNCSQDYLIYEVIVNKKEVLINTPIGIYKNNFTNDTSLYKKLQLVFLLNIGNNHYRLLVKPEENSIKKVLKVRDLNKNLINRLNILKEFEIRLSSGGIPSSANTFNFK